MSKEIDHEFTDEIVCPYCGYEDVDSWEYSDDGVAECPDCDREFEYLRNIRVTYTTEKINNKED